MDANNITPRFEFGYGLSYTTFAYSGFSTSASGTSQSFTFTVKNSGSIAGTEIPQLYISYPTSSGEPKRVLRGFDEVQLGAGASKTVTLTVNARELRYVTSDTFTSEDS
jgi:beta-glucosidase